MKKQIFIVCCLLIACIFCACKKNDIEIQEPVNFYYCNEEISYQSASGVIGTEVRDAIAYGGDLQKLLKDYLKGPQSSDLYLPLPENTSFKALKISENVAYITFSDEIASLSGIRLTTACSCIAMTICEYTAITEVCIQAQSEQLENKDMVVIRPSELVLIDNTV